MSYIKQADSQGRLYCWYDKEELEGFLLFEAYTYLQLCGEPLLIEVISMNRTRALRQKFFDTVQQTLNDVAIWLDVKYIKRYTNDKFEGVKPNEA